MELLKLEKDLKSNPYPGRGIVIGRSDCGTKAVIAYFIMGRSENSRNRIFKETGTGIRTAAFDESKMKDPSLVIYNAVRILGNKTIITNGDQTDTIYDLMNQQFTFEQALRTREFEPDKPNYTPRISGIVRMEMFEKNPRFFSNPSVCDSKTNSSQTSSSGRVYNNDFNYALSILKSGDGCPDSVYRYNFAYNNPCIGEGHFIHTYKSDGEPLPSFEGEPKRVEISGDIDSFTKNVWEALNADNKVSLFTRFIDVKTGGFESRIVNKNK